MTKNGCHNRAPLRETAVVQDGWFDNGKHVLSWTRQPRMIEIINPMSKSCQYQKLKKDDPKCAGCKELTI